uniref:protein-tyrosine-phosphatase n=1 Tax=Eutreptiella gymnastica TaxID=73025 RepID=A0A7S4FYG2_9EUGL
MPLRLIDPEPQQHEFRDDDMHEIRPRLFVGNLHAAYNVTRLSQCGIQTVLTCEPHAEAPLDAEQDPTSPPFLHRRIGLADQPHPSFSAQASFAQGCDIISEALQQDSGAILVHCFGGQNRSVSLICAYLMLGEGWDVSKAMEFIKAKHPLAEPNAFYMNELEKWAQERSKAAVAKE